MRAALGPAMRPASAVFALISCAVAWKAASGAEPDQLSIANLRAKYPEAVVEKLLEKRSVVLPRGDDDFEGFRALVIFDAPPAQVMRLLSQGTRQAEYRPELREVRAVGRHEGRSIEQHRLRIAFINVVYRVSTHVDFEKFRIAWELDARYDNDVERVEGYWEIAALTDGRSLGHFATIVDVGPAVPNFLEYVLTARLLPDSIENMRRWVDSKGRYRP